MTGARLGLLLACFFLSGVAGLVYETVWVQQFSFVYGAAEVAMATVLGAYMAGLAGGAAVAARWAPRVRRPVRVYAMLELGIGISALAVGPAIVALQRLHAVLFGGADLAPPAALSSLSFYLLATFAVLVVPTGLMGATLPLVAGYAVRRPEHMGPRIAALYAANTAGAAAGALLGAFVLLPRFALASVILVGVGINTLVFLGAALLDRVSTGGAVAARFTAVRGPRYAGAQWILPLVFVAGAVALALEVLWTRLLGHVLGGSIYALGTMLAAFLVGLAGGSALAIRAARAPDTARSAFCWSQVGVAAFSLASFALAGTLPSLARYLGTSGFLIPTAVVSGVALLPAALCMGAAFPLAARILAGSVADAASASGRVFAWNTVGAITGAVASTFVVLPIFRFGGTMALLATASLGAAAAAALLSRPRLRPVAALCVTGIVAVALAPPAPPWPLLQNSPLGEREQYDRVLYYGVGRSATVLLQEFDDSWRLTTNGLPESVIMPAEAPAAPVAVARWMGLLALVARPGARSLLVIGLGAGNTVLDIPDSVRSIDVVEIEPEVVAAVRALPQGVAKNPLADDRVRIHVNDARNALALTDRRFDVIVSQPSHPWTTASSHLYTREFFELVDARLDGDGVFVQWMGLQFVDQVLLRSIVATLREVFSEVEVYQPNLGGGVLFLAANEPLAVAQRAREALATAAAEWAAVGALIPEDILMYRVLDGPASASFAAGASPNTDYRNLVKVGSPLALRDPLGIIGARRLFATPQTTILGRLDIDHFYVLRHLVAHRALAPAQALVPHLSPPGRQRAALGLIALASGDEAAAERLFWQAARADATDLAPFYGLYLLHREDIVRGTEPLGIADRLALDRGAAALLEGERALRAGDWSRVRALDPGLAEIDPHHLFFEPSARLRAAWRVESGDPDVAREAIFLLAPLAAGRERGTEAHLLRARAALVAGAPKVLSASLWHLARSAELSGVEIEEAQMLLAQADLGGNFPKADELSSRLQSLQR